MSVKVFTDLLIWQRSQQWSKAIFQYTQAEPFKSDRRLVEQINDSSESVMANIAEGFGRGTQGEFIQFLGYSLGSPNETQSHLTTAYDRGYIPKNEYATLFAEGTEIRKMTVSFITSMIMPSSGVKNVRKLVNWNEHVWQLYERITGKERPDFFKQHGPAARSAVGSAS